MTVSLAPDIPAAYAATAGNTRPEVQQQESVEGDIGAVKQAASRAVAKAAVKTPPIADLPKAAVATLPVQPAGEQDNMPVGELAVGVAAPEAAKVSKSDTSTPNQVRVEVLDQKAAQKAGVNGVLLRVSRDDQTQQSGQVQVSLDYSTFAPAYGGDWAQRLRLVQLPDCLADPKTPCGSGTSLPSHNDVADKTLSASVTLPAAPDAASTSESAPADSSAPAARSLAAAPSGAVLLAATAAPAGSTGNWAATPLSPSASWDVGEQTGEFSWSYPMTAPPSAGGPEPSLSLGYSSSSTDGRVASTNNQASWAGEGFDLASGYVERSYVPCSQDTTGASNATHPSGDLCWRSDNATLVFGGGAGELVRDKVSGIWRFKNDDGSRIERLTGAANGDNDGEYWRLTTQDGTQYYFGISKRYPADTAQTQSTWTVPVFGNHANEPCQAASFAASSCAQAWRWNLDYVVDPDGNTMTYFYAPEHNRYGKDNNSASVDYVRGGVMERIEYGTRKGSEHTTPAPAQVVFTPAERCLPSGSITCKPEELTAANAASWPDVPFDQICASTTSCPTNTSPTFFTTKRLASITTQVRSGSGYSDVDVWTLTHSFPDPGDGTKPSLWLDSLQHTGKTGSDLSLPKLTFDGVRLTNRVDIADGRPALNKWRIRAITAETGGLLSVNYADPDCPTGAAKPAEDANTKRCFPVFWDANNTGTPVKDWFHKYVVSSVVTEDRTAGGLQEPTTYTYLGDPAWHYDAESMTPAAERTWSQWRGYGKVRVSEGQSGKTQTVSDYTFFRGMDDDLLAGGGKRDVKVTDSEGVAIDDNWRLNGFVREQVSYNNGEIAEGEISTPWISAATADDGAGTTAHLLDTAKSRTRTALDGNRGWRQTETSLTYDQYGLTSQINELGDLAVTGDEQCTRYSYSSNPTTWLIDFKSREEVVAKDCGQSVQKPNDLISDDLTLYDGGQIGAAPTAGNVTSTQSLSGWANGAPTYITDLRNRYDANGRVIETLDAADGKSTTAFTPASGGPVTAITTTNALGHATTTTLDPARGVLTGVTDPNGKQSAAEYDALGRLVRVWLPGRDKATQTPNLQHEYLIRNDAPSVVTTKALGPDGTYLTSTTLMDTLFRPRQIQSQAAGGGRVVIDTLYDDRGLNAKESQPYFNDDSGPSTTLLSVSDPLVPAQTVTTYDGMERPTVEVYRIKGVDKWRTTTSYGGDRVSVDPPAGAVATTAIVDADELTTELRQYKGDSPTGAFDATTYGYDASGNRIRVTDSVGNTWRYGYDLRGRKIKEEDPDAGATTFTYDALDQQTSATDSRGKTVTTAYDALGRPAARFDGDANGTKIAEWVYDTLAKGQLTSATRIAGTKQYTSAVTGYNDDYQETGSSITIPTEEGALAGTYTYGSTYNIDGSLATLTLPAKGNLPAETLKYGYDTTGNDQTLTGLRPYVLGSAYAKTGEVLQYSLALSDQHKKTWETFTYEEGTARLKTAMLTREGVTGTDTDLGYRYDDAGNVLSIADAPTATGTSPETQCFGYDYLQRLTEAWTQNGTCAATPAPQTITGPAPYWTSYTYDPTGNRTKEVQHDTSGGTADTTRTYSYPQAGQPQPHALKQVTTAGPKGNQTDTYTYDTRGNTTGRTIGAKQQGLTWDAEGSLATVTEGTATTSFLYDADGERLIRREPTATTLYLPSGMELTLDTAAGSTVKGTRYYSHNDDIVAVRQGGTVQFLMDDHQGTAETAVNGTTYAATTRRTAPFGASRGTEPATWPGQRGFVGGTNDPTTGLTHLGAREYDSSTGRFVSLDPIVDFADPQQINGYAYAGNNPVTSSDPDGQYPSCATCSGVDGAVVRPKSKKRIKNNTDSNPTHCRTCGVPTRKKILTNPHTSKKRRAQIARTQTKMKKQRGEATKRRKWHEQHDASCGGGRCDEPDKGRRSCSAGGYCASGRANDAGLLGEGRKTIPKGIDWASNFIGFGVGGLVKQMAKKAIKEGIKEGAKGGVYVLRDAAGKVVRTGRTKNLTRREAEHARAKSTKDFKFEAVHKTDNYKEQRGLEQHIWEKYGQPTLPGVRRTSPIRAKSPRKQAYMDAANKYLQGK
ncbi:RHS repeat-associated core domain-containing protein [Nonomuraea sp. NPDC050556]|uniref:RHS repeat-associated core domain-containing protein n=1 Tax=Nonomuraea sp. NPDC050556 TaxID=3364369 RepID=UPI003788B6C2